MMHVMLTKRSLCLVKILLKVFALVGLTLFVQQNIIALPATHPTTIHLHTKTPMPHAYTHTHTQTHTHTHTHTRTHTHTDWAYTTCRVLISNTIFTKHRDLHECTHLCTYLHCYVNNTNPHSHTYTYISIRAMVLI